MRTSDIPETVKIQGRMVRVRYSARGYVCVGESDVEARDLFKGGDEAWEKAKELSADPTGDWQRHMVMAFDKALWLERKRLKPK